ncbi:zeta toxin family protein [Limosilactobacillus kribbianus]|uniref:zeta toxin family protein n=1 Tax=Limosilactobacillus kribbianus TaxID=2982695 RepID=UPI0022655A3A|nr:zeta toxin family protein [Limosilactobacillus kribbianus]
MKQYIIFAGVNGAGKSTIYQTSADLFRNTVRINADEILRAFQGNWRKEGDNFKAMRKAVLKLDQAFQNGDSINQETTLASSFKAYKRRIDEAHKLGYQVSLYYVGLANPDIAVSRVQQRVAKGGHGVPEELIRRRYKISLIRLNQLAKYFDEANIYDNSTSHAVLVFSREGSRVITDNTEGFNWLNGITLR